jgi:hypothetical protein
MSKRAQIQIGALFRYERCPEFRRPDASNLIAEAWLACKPLVDFKTVICVIRQDAALRKQLDPKIRPRGCQALRVKSE